MMIIMMIIRRYTSTCTVVRVRYTITTVVTSYGESRSPVFSPRTAEPEREAGPAAMPPPPRGEAGM